MRWTNICSLTVLVTVALLAQPSEPTSAHDPGARIVIAPDYPALAFALPNGGNVHVDVTIDDQGKVTAAKADRKSTRLNSSHVSISYAVFCLKKKKTRTLDIKHLQPKLLLPNTTLKQQY